MGVYLDGPSAVELPNHNEPTNASTVTTSARRAGIMSLRISAIRASPVTYLSAIPALDLNSNKITSLADPTSDQDATTKAYVDNLIQGVRWKEPVDAATTASIANLQSVTVATIDGITLVQGDRVLVKDTASADGVEALDAKRNGIYAVGAVNGGTAPFTRALDFDENDEISVASVFVEAGTTNVDSAWVLTTDAAITLDTTALTFVQFAGVFDTVAGDGLVRDGVSISVVGTTNRIVANAGSVDIGTDVVTLTGAQSLTDKTIANSLTFDNASGANPVLASNAVTQTLDLTGRLDVSGDLTLAATKKVVLDGGFDTFIVESAANTIDIEAGGVKAVTITNTATTFNNDISVTGAAGANGAVSITPSGITNGQERGESLLDSCGIVRGGF